MNDSHRCHKKLCNFNVSLKKMTVENAKSFVKHLVEDGNELNHDYLSKIGTEFTKQHMQ